MGKNTATSAGTSLAAMSVEKVVGGTAGRVGGALVQPAVWVAGGQSPDAGDVFIYGTGLFGGMAGGASIVTGIVKGFVDDHTAKRVRQAAADEPTKFRSFIKAASDYGFWEQGGAIGSMSIAAAGGTAWQKHGGLWVYITDAESRLIPDYMPTKFLEIRQPVLPLQPSRGGYKWHRIRT